MVSEKFYLVSPDAGSNKKIFDLAKKINYNGEIVRCDKLRDIVTGKIIETIVYKDDLNGKDAIIVDDICDGGRTFIEIAKKLRERNVGKVYLVVTHGIFSNSFLELSRHLDGIFTTNSVRNVDIESDSDYTVNKDFVKQYNVF